MIPKTIHYCWFSGEKPNRFTRNCIKSWKQAMPDYEIKCWDANSFDFNSVPFVKEAFEAKKWAFVADYIRIYALYTEGGIYLDSDVKTFKPFDVFLTNQFFIGTEPPINNKVVVEAAIMGAEPFHPYLKDCLDYYGKLHFIKGDMTMLCPGIMSRVMEKYGYKHIDECQKLETGIQIYDQTYFGHYSGTPRKDYYAIHYFDGSWRDEKHGPVTTFLKENDLLDIYFKFLKFLKII